MKYSKIFILALMLMLPALLEAETPTEPSQELEEGYVYDPGGRRDPFIPLIDIDKKPDVGSKKAPRVLGTLESYDIPDFKLIAVIKKATGSFVGLVLATDNKTFTVRPGTTIGLRNGKVLEINSEKMVVEEYVEDYKGEKIPRQVVLELYKEG